MAKCSCGLKQIPGKRCPCRPPKPAMNKRPDTPVQSVRVGTIFERKLSLTFPKVNSDCQCTAIKNKMNRLGPAGCAKYFDELVSEVLASAKSHSLLGRIAASLPLAKHRVSSLLRQSILEAEK